MPSVVAQIKNIAALQIKRKYTLFCSMVPQNLDWCSSEPVPYIKNPTTTDTTPIAINAIDQVLYFAGISNCSLNDDMRNKFIIVQLYTNFIFYLPMNPSPLQFRPVHWERLLQVPPVLPPAST